MAKDGSIYWVRSVIMPFFGPDNKVNSYVAVRTPITDAMREVETAIVKQQKGEPISQEMARLIKELRDGDYSSYYWLKLSGESKM